MKLMKARSGNGKNIELQEDVKRSIRLEAEEGYYRTDLRARVD